MKDFDLSLYLVTDRNLMTVSSLAGCVEQAIAGGVTMVQLREKNISSREFFDLACELLKVTKHYKIPLIINDRVDIALACSADGVHLGQSDLPAAVARKILGSDKIIGVTAPSVALASKALADGADYIGVGAIFGTTTKPEAKKGSIALLEEISAAVEIPIVAIGGINAANAGLLRYTGIDGLAVISGILAQDNITEAARSIKRAFKG